MNLQVTKVMGDAQKSMSSSAFHMAGSILSEGKNVVREELQGETLTQINDIINKLSGQIPISTEEIKVIKLWIVGDAEIYTKMENNFQDWLNEYERLTKILEDYENKDLTVENLLKLHGILEDATRVSYDIANFLEKKDRIQKFESAVADGLDKDERDMLVRVLSQKLRSTNT